MRRDHTKPAKEDGRRRRTSQEAKAAAAVASGEVRQADVLDVHLDAQLPVSEIIRVQGRLLVSRQMASRVFGVRSITIDHWIGLGLPVEPNRGSLLAIDLLKAVPWHRAWMESEKGKNKLDGARTDLAKRQEEKIQLDLDERRGKLISSERA